MKIFFPFNSWRGGFLSSIEKACMKLGYETFFCQKYIPSLTNKILRKIKPLNIASNAEYRKILNYNSHLLNQIEEFCPDIFFNISGSNLFPETLKIIRNNLKCKTICLIADNPFDPSPRRDKYFPMTLMYYDLLLLPEPIWGRIINNVAPNAKVIPFYGGYDPDNFFQPESKSFTMEDMERYSSEVSFTGASYNDSPEGAYRAGILGMLDGYKVKIWGDSGWNWRVKHYPILGQSYQGERLPYEQLRKLYSITKINLNLPSPQIFTGFQPRVFEIAASKGFQIIDHSDELYKFYLRDEIVTFKNLIDLREKISYFLVHEDERNEIVEKMYNITVDNYTWEKQIKLVLDQVL